MSFITAIKYIIFLVFGSFVVVFSQYNDKMVELLSPFYDYRIALPVYVLVFICLLVGVLLGAFCCFIRKFKNFFYISDLKKRIHALETEIASLKMDGEIIDTTLAE